MALIEHLEKLRHFKRICQFNSIKSAAQATGISQAGLSKSLASLEEIVGVQLLVRSSAGVKLTKEGRLLLAAAEKITAEAESVEIEIKSLSQVKVPQFFRVGMYDSIAVYFFDTLNKYLQKTYPHVQIELVVDRSAKLFNMVESNEVDMCFGVASEDEIKKKLQSWVLYEDHFSFFMNPKCAEFVDEKPYIIYPEARVQISSTQEMNMQDYIRSKKLTTKNVHHVFNFETVKTLTELRVGIGVLPNLVAQPLLASKRLVRVAPKNVPQFFGKHKIIMASKRSFENKHSVFLKDLLNLALDWTKK